jgi:hypothetical protein
MMRSLPLLSRGPTKWSLKYGQIAPRVILPPLAALIFGFSKRPVHDSSNGKQPANTNPPVLFHQFSSLAFSRLLLSVSLTFYLIFSILSIFPHVFPSHTSGISKPDYAQKLGIVFVGKLK